MDAAIKEEPYKEDNEGDDKELMGETTILGNGGRAFREEKTVES